MTNPTLPPHDLFGDPWVTERVPQADRDPQGFYLEYFSGRTPTATYFAWSHYDAACDYLRRDDPDAPLNDVGEVIVNFTEAELRAMPADDDQEDA